jgi:outer membrane murein-binding lipoprotein Lpp
MKRNLAIVILSCVLAGVISLMSWWVVDLNALNKSINRDMNKAREDAYVQAFKDKAELETQLTQQLAELTMLRAQVELLKPEADKVPGLNNLVVSLQASVSTLTAQVTTLTNDLLTMATDNANMLA